ncbi:zinc-dependent alcohol dehydrogenase family protein [Dyella silvatica]|uniref:zinc-dependent alcohol dehydrogenase family protein n=1 Tax=Dyella silvatica TaxID=2992128 RepID=UPI0022522C01|nr:NAD(P)-dependent alcohol dehydrogenase [Dyella silvatica]
MNAIVQTPVAVPSAERMQSYHMSMGAGLDGLLLKQHEVPTPGPHEVLLRVRAVSLNYRELMIMLQGRYPLPVKADVIGVSDGAGEVIALGHGVSRVKLGDRVIASIFPRWIDGPFSIERAAQLGGSLDGMLTEYAVLHEDALVHIPEHLSWQEAATLPCAAVTAWNALTGGHALKAGDNVLVLGSGSVSLFALQFAKACGARVIATTSSDDKAVRLRELGADDVINYRSQPDWSAEVRRLSGGIGVQHVVEVGGGSTMPQSLKSVCLGGEIAFVGTAAGGESMIDANAIFASGAVIRAVAAGHRTQLTEVTRLMTEHRIKPVIDRVFAFDQAPAAFAYYANQRRFGKVVISVA